MPGKCTARPPATGILWVAFEQLRAEVYKCRLRCKHRGVVRLVFYFAVPATCLSQRGPARVSHQSGVFRVRVPQQGLSHLRKCPARVFSKSPTRMFCRSLPQKCLIRVLQQDCLPRVHSRSTHSSVRRGCLKGLYGKNVVQQCSRAGLAEVFHKTVSQEFGTWVSCKSVF